MGASVANIPQSHLIATGVGGELVWQPNRVLESDRGDDWVFGEGLEDKEKDWRPPLIFRTGVVWNI